MKKLTAYIITILTFSLMAACAAGPRTASGGEVTGVGGSSWTEQIGRASCRERV